MRQAVACAPGEGCVVERSDVRELHYITPVENVPSILARGILAHNLAARLAHRSVADEQVQGRRREKAVPGGRRLHDYVNLYICARNPMLFRLHGDHPKLCVLRVNPEVLDLPGAVIADGNAASGYTSFRPAPAGLSFVDKDTVFAERWTEGDQIEVWEKTRVKCAEVLVPARVDPRWIVGA
jgi:hypothetical protein